MEKKIDGYNWDHNPLKYKKKKKKKLESWIVDIPWANGE